MSTLSACSAGDPAGGEGGRDHEETGTLDLAVTLGSVTLNSVSYSITKGAYSKTGNIDVSNSNTVSAIVSVPAGAGYTINLTGTDATDPALTCSASAPFDVTAGGTTSVAVTLRCTMPDRTGTVRISGSLNVCPRIDGLAVSPAETTVGHDIGLAAEAADADTAPSPLTYAFTATGGTLAGATTPNAIFTCTAAGAYDVTLTVSDGDCTDSVTATVTCSPGSGTPPPPPAVKVNEVESNGGTPGDWTELYNAGTTPANVSGWVVKDNDDTHAYTIPAGTVIPAGGYYVVEEAAQNFGLGGGDSVRLFNASGALVDSYTWTAHAATTYGRCPNGTGAFGTSVTSTKGLANNCAPVGPVTFAWPGVDDVAPVDVPAQFTSNLSGLTYEPATATSPAVLWAVVNGPGTLFRMLKSGSQWVPDGGDWLSGKALHYTNGLGNPDSEGVTYGSSVADGMYVATERNNDASTVSRNAVLRFDAGAAGTQLTATHDWDITSQLPATGANLGLEGVTFVPDTFLVSKGFFDESKSLPYDPTDYPGHGAGLFVVGVEGTGMLHVFALSHTSGAATRLATFTSGNPGSMGLEFDRAVGYLWATCDDTCGNKASVLDVDTTAGSPTLGRFVVRRQFNRPTTLPDTNNEGIAIAPESECSGGVKPFFWSDDNDLGGNSLRVGTVTCGRFLP